ncbi:heavy metal translocating P-type ATPase [Shimwellia blattae]|uniref:P-type Zn(2+) transporter n=1 Tax=Shimwellia blattae (strain ATCC 29907 / DSM 4481 / JCM 1650 / NBRC 105725 / CDC 9005-74) TaxID=630626 RepID=I2BBJ7_SHIBC|nr:heavy metal translocating P-type ATPase [Shimwellia blattae]AFJ47901.1 putative heavy metal translocating P-type ATPase [Shimwellia blattae DSM 4481 = NBRC 105725]GAB79529.1 putative metal transporting ATPase [Shimwellia blattae DSM 4481 = NBRC 105725]VDY65401.1 Copper-exporting P-type ATPase A [Shimwellia blattae]VEC24490.1 Copper-exporting P-type ATPase A [Shimwellia blattae]
MSHPATQEISVVHSLPGRVRLRVPQLARYPDAALWFRQQLLSLPGVSGVRLRPEACSVIIEYHPQQTDSPELLRQIAHVDWQQQAHGEYEPEYCMADNLVNAGGLALAQFLPRKWATLPTLLLTAPTIQEGLETLSRRQLRVEVLDALALGVSMARGDNRTAMITQTLLTLGEYMEQETSRHSDALLASLMQPHEHPVWVERNGQSVEISSSELAEGDVMLLGPGDNIPADGTVLRGVGLINQASMTGESVPVRREYGAWLYAGTQVQEGNIAVVAERVGEASSTASIRRFITDSLSQRSETQQVTQQMADRRVAITLGVGAAVFAMTRDVRRLASVFLVDYSCALKLSTPIAFKSVMYRAARSGLLLKGGRAIEQLAAVDTVVFDKTGTLTMGDMQVTDVVSFDPQHTWAERLLAIAASVEEHSNHPLARAVVAAAAHHELPHINHGEVEYVIAHGLICELDGHQMQIGSHHFLSEHYPIDFAPYQAEIDALEQQGRHLLFIGLDNKLVGMIGLQDNVRPEAADIIAGLRAGGIQQVILLTGDNAHKAEQLATTLGIDRYYAQSTPDSKVEVVRQLQEQGHRVLFVGDGINDAPVLTQADVGLAMNQSTELAQQAADAVLLQDNLHGVATARTLALEAMKLVNSNIKITEWVNSSIMLAAALGWLSPGASALLHNGTTLGVLLRSLSARKKG